MKYANVSVLFEMHNDGTDGCFYPSNAAVPETTAPAIPDVLKRATPVGIPQVSEPEIIRHFTVLSHRNFSVDTDFYPLGSCTMKYNPRINEKIAARPDIAGLHPYQSEDSAQGMLGMLYEVQEYFAQLTGMPHFTLQPAAGAHGELTGIKIIMAYHARRKDRKRTKVIVPDSSHGTNPATAALCGCEVIEIKSNAAGLVDIDALKAVLNDEVACLMMTNPNTLGLFEKDILTIAALVHEAGAFLYYDGANMNALLDVARPGDMGFDVMHINVHKTFSTPHGGGGPGAGPVGVCERLKDFLPVPVIVRKTSGKYALSYKVRHTIGKVKVFYGNVGVVLKAYCYIRMLGLPGLKQVSEDAIINANYIKKQLASTYGMPHSEHCMHEFVCTTERWASKGIHPIDVGKRLLDFGFHAPTVSFPLHEALMIEPTETESRATLDSFIAAMKAVAQEIETDATVVKTAPHTMPIRRCDEVKAARTPRLVW